MKKYFSWAESDYYNRMVKWLNVEEAASTFIELRFLLKKMILFLIP